MSGVPARITVDSASASRAIAAPSTRSKPNAPSSPTTDLHGDPGRQAVDVGLAQHRNVGTGDRQAEQSPRVCDLLGCHAELFGRGRQGVDRASRPLQDVTGEPEQSAALFGFHHLLDREAEVAQILDQIGALARIGSSPAALLAGSSNIENDFDLSEITPEGDTEWLEAKPKARESTFEWVRLGFSRDGVLKAMELHDNFWPDYTAGIFPNGTKSQNSTRVI